MRIPAVSPVTALVGGGVTGWMCFGGAGVGFSAVLMGLVIFSGIAISLGLGGGSVFSLVTTGAGLGASEVSTPVSSVRCVGGKRNRGDHGGLDGSDACGIFSPVAGLVMEEECRANDSSGNQTVQHERAGEGAADPVTVDVVAVAELEVRCYGTLLTVSAAG